MTRRQRVQPDAWGQCWSFQLDSFSAADLLSLGVSRSSVRFSPEFHSGGFVVFNPRRVTAVRQGGYYEAL